MKNLAQSIKHLSFKCVIIISLILCHAAIAPANTPVSGNITTDTTWTLDNSPYIVTKDISVLGTDGEDDVTTLTIEPGVVVRFAAGSGLGIGTNNYSNRGALIARGTETEPIIFTSHAQTPAPGDWDGIFFRDYNRDDLTVLEHCVVEYGGANGNGNLFFYRSSGRIKNCRIEYSSSNGIYLDRSNGDGFIDSCIITHNNGNGIFDDSTNSDNAIANNTISGNGGYPVKVHANQIAKVENNVGSDNMSDHIVVTGGIVKQSGTWKKQGFDFSIASDVNIYGSSSSNVTVLTVEPGVKLRFAAEAGLGIGANHYHYRGALIAQGTETEPIIFTSHAQTPAPGDWDGIFFRDYNRGDLTVIEHCVIEYGGKTTGNISVTNTSPTIQYNTIRHSAGNGIHISGSGSKNARINCNTIMGNVTGIKLDSYATPGITGNDFKQNSSYGINNTSGRAVEAVDNYWNDENGPGYNGDDISGNIQYSPWLTEPSTCQNNPPTNIAPQSPVNPVPADGAVNVILTGQALTVAWSCFDLNVWDTLTYDVYIGNAEDTLVLAGQDLTEPTFAFAGLERGNRYFWQIVARDTGNNLTQGPVWQFITQGDPPDLIVNQISWEPQTDITAHEQITLKAIVQNVGTGPVLDPFQILFRINGTDIKTVTADTVLLAGEATEVSATWIAQAGDHVVEVTADSANTISETDETNNSRTETIIGIIDPAPPELVSTWPPDQSVLKAVNQIVMILSDAHGEVDDPAVINSIQLKNDSGQTISGETTENDNVFTFVPVSLPLADGKYTVSFVAADLWGNTHPHQLSFEIDTVPPSIPTLTGGVVDSGILQVQPFQNFSSNPQVTLTGTREPGTRAVVILTSSLIQDSINSVLTVGASRQYQTIQDAIDAASDGDLILIEPGLYLENITLDKWVHLKGSSMDPSDVIIRSPGNVYNGYPGSFVCQINTPSPLGTPLYIEGITIEPYAHSWNGGLGLPDSSESGTGTIVFNRCHIRATGTNYPVYKFGYTEPPETIVRFVNCNIKKGYSHFHRMNAPNWRLEKSVLNGNYSCYQCTETPEELDYVTEPASDYGAGQGVWYFGYQAVSDFGNDDWSVEITLPEGDNTLEILLEDRAGNMGASLWVDIMVDSRAPVVEQITPAPDSFLNIPPDGIVVDYTDETAGQPDMDQSILSVKDGSLMPVPGTWTDSGTGQIVFTPSEPFEESVYHIEIRLQDTRGNQGEVHVSHFTVDTTVPPQPDMEPVTSPSPAATQLLKGDKEAYAAILINDERVVDHTNQTAWDHLVTLEQGENRFIIKAVDRAGNESDPVEVTVVYDDTAPLAVDTLAVHPDGDGMSVLAEWTGYDESTHGDIAGYRIYVETSGFDSVVALTPYRTVEAGIFETIIRGLERDRPYYIAVVAVDTTGNALENVSPLSAVPRDILPPKNPTQLSFTCFEDRLILNWIHSQNSDNDLAGYRIYVNGETEPAGIAPDRNQFETTGLTPATAYEFKLTAMDTNGNESSGTTIQGITLLANPLNLSVVPYSGYANLTWDAASPASYVKQYRIYVSETPFTGVSSMPPRQTTTKLSTGISGLDNNTPYYFAVTAVNLSGGEQKQVTAVASTPADDTTGPELTGITFEDAPFVDGQSIAASGRIRVEMDDPAGISAVEFYFNTTLIRKDFSEPYSAYIDIFTLADGTYPLTITGIDTLGNSATYEYTLAAGLDAPAAPVITLPETGFVTNKTQVRIEGTTDKYTDVTLIHDGAQTNATVTVGPLGIFSIPYELNNGENRIRAVAKNRSGQSPESSEIRITVDTALPDSPRSLSAESRPDGAVKLMWQRPLNKVVEGFNLYRLGTEFSDKTQAVKINSGLITSPGYTDLPTGEGTWFYRVLAVDAAGNESGLSNPAIAVSDNTPPKAVRIEYASRGMVDPVSGRYGPARVDVTLEVSEPLGAQPFLTLTPGGGIPRTVELEKTSDQVYSGFFDILETTPEGVAYAVFSARDVAGNRGTRIESGDRLLLDTQGPQINRLEISPASPVKNSSDAPVDMQFSFGLSEKIKPGTIPQISLDIAGGRQIIDLPGITQIPPETGEAQAWQAVISLPDDAGLLGPETIEIKYKGRDDLDNLSSDILVNHQFQVYQGGLPPLAPPSSLTGKALSRGRIELTWEAVENAAAYRIYRQAPGETELTQLDVVDGQTTYIDTTETDGIHEYAVVTVRRQNQEESASGFSNTVQVASDSVAPHAPVNLSLDMVPQGIRAQWEAPAFTEPVTYSIYRSDQAEITSVDGLTPLVTDVNQLMIIDPTPSPTEHCYAVTAVDETGNESLPSNSFYLNVDLLPVSRIQVSQKDYDPPQVSWSHADKTGKIAGYFLYIGKDRTGFKVNEVAMTAESFTDYGYAGEDRSYTVVAVDTNAAESMSRFVTLPKISAELSRDTVIKRGIMNRLNYTVHNPSTRPVSNITLLTQLGGQTHPSQPFSLDPGESETVPVIVGGYRELADIEPLVTTIRITPNPGEEATIIRTRDIEVQESLMVLEIKNDEFLRGGAGKVWFTLHNPGAADAEIITAENSNKKPSAQIRYYLVDEDDNVLYSKSFKQSLGNYIITLPNKKTVARIAPDQIFTSEAVDLFVPANVPDTVYVRLEIDHIYHRLGQAGEVKMGGTQTRRRVSLKETSYFGEILSILPEVSKGDQEILITGRAVDRNTGESVGNALLNLIIAANGFERKISVTTDDTGSFTHTFSPLENEAGIFKVHAVHTDLLDRPEQGSFIINQVDIRPSKINLSIPKNYEQKISIKINTQKGTALTGLRLETTGDIPEGVHLTLDDPVPFVAADTGIAMNLTLWADNNAEESGSLELAVKSDESADPWGSVLINTHFSESRPVLYFTPDHIETGVARDDIITETLTLKNQGLADMGDVTLALTDESGRPAPGWVRLNTPPNIGTLAVGEERKVSISFLPGTGIDEGLHIFYLKVTSSNYPDTNIGLYPTVTASGVGNALFKISDIYTGTFNAKNELIRGLANAKIRLQNEKTLSDHTATTDSHGEALFEDLSAGVYKCRITASNHQEYTGRVWIKPGITVSKDIFLEYNLVTVEWEVNEITIQDKYEIILTATFETDVPAAVVVANPLSVTLPDMEKGDVYHGEFILVNHGLIRAEELEIPIPESDEFFQYEILTGIPDTLEAKQRITIPYRVTSLKSLDQAEENGTGGGCYTYRSSIRSTYTYPCANGNRSSGSTQHRLHKSATGSCGGGGSGGGGGGGGGGGYFIGGGGGGGSVSSPAPRPTPMPSDEQKCLPKPEFTEPGNMSNTANSSSNDVMNSLDNETTDNSCDVTQQNRNVSVSSAVNTVYRQFTDQAQDLWVRVPNGRIAVQREYRYGQWVWNHLSTVTDGRPDDRNAYTRSEYGPDYVTKDRVPYKKTSPGVYRQGTYTIERLTDCDQYTGTPDWGACMQNNRDDYSSEKYRFTDKSGNWKIYDSPGRLMSYGNRRGMIASFVYDGTDEMQPAGILDSNGTQVLWLAYDIEGNLTRVYDTDARQVEYEYTGGNLTRIIDVMGNETVYTYDGQNNITQKTDANGHTTTITYNATHDPVRVEDAQGNTFTFEYDYDKNKKEYYALIQNPEGQIKEVWYTDKGETKRVDINGRTIQKIDQDGRIHTITDERGLKTVKEYDERRNLKRITYPDNTQILYEYDLRFNRIKTRQDPLNRITRYEYDDAGNPVQKIEAKGTAIERTTTYTYDDAGQLLTVTTQADTDTDQAVTTYTYDDYGNLATVTDPENQTIRFPEYDIMGNPLKMQDARGKEWTYAYDAKGRLITSTDPMNNETSYEYDGLGNRTAVIDARGNRTAYTYDHKSNLTEMLDPLNGTTRFEYSRDNQLLRQIDPEGSVTTYEYDADRRLVKTADGAGNTTRMLYNLGGCSSCSGGDASPDRIIYPTFEKAFSYDKRGRQISETDHLTDTLSHTTAFEYDKAGNRVKQTDRMGKETHYVYDDLNRLKTTVDPADGFTDYAYDSRNNLIRLTDAGGNTTRFEYDRLNRLVKEIRPLGQETHYAYDPSGNLVQRIDAENRLTAYTYDDAGRLTRIRYHTTALDPDPVKTVAFTYDKQGNLLTYTDGTTSGTYVYDALNRKVSETVDFGPFEKTLAQTWYKNNLKKSLTLPGADPYLYTYHEDNRLAEIEIPDLGTVSHAAYTWTRPDITLLPGGSLVTRTYDPLMRQTGITATDPGANPIMALGYSFDAENNITARTTQDGDYAYTYDDLYRLTDSNTPDIPDLSDEAFTYDPVGNRLTASDTIGHWTYNGNNELESRGSTGYDYDANGNLTQKTVNGSVTRFFYNIENRLIRVEDGSGTIIAQYGYDPFGRRIWKEVSNNRTYYLYSDEGLAGEYTETGTQIRAYGWQPGSVWGTDPLFMKEGSEYYFYHNDHLGTPQKMTAVNGAVVWSAKYSSFGQAFVDQASTVENNLRFPGQYYDVETGYHYNYHRYYDPQIGRYLRTDPIGVDGGINLFVYCLNDPVNLVDPEGLRTIGRPQQRWYPPPPVNPMPKRRFPALNELPEPSTPGYKNPILPDPRYETICFKWECRDPETCETSTGPWLSTPNWHPSNDKNCTCKHWGWKYP